MNRRDHRNELEAETQVDSASLGSFPEILEFLAEHGFAGMAQTMQMHLNEVMKLVSTRKVTAVMGQLCGREVPSMQVSRAVEALDD